MDDQVTQTSSTDCIEIPPATDLAAEPWSLHKIWGLLKCFGPAAILASMSIGAGETIVVVKTGAWAHYDLLWVVLLACLVKGGSVTYMLGRYTAISGEYIGHRLVRFPGPRGWFLILIVGVEVMFAPLAWVVIAKPCGDLLHHLIGQQFFAGGIPGGMGDTFWINLFTTLFIAAALVVSLTLTYERLEKEQLAICGILVLGTIIGTVMVWPDFGAAARGTLLRIGRFPESSPEWAPPDAVNYPWLNLATVFAYIGGSVTTYIVYANWIGLRGWGLTSHPEIEKIRQRAARSSRIDYLPDDPVQRRRLFRLTAPLRWDVTLGATVLFIVTAAFMVSGAAVLYDEQSRFEKWSLLTDQAHIWRNIHPWLTTVYYVTVIAALWGTLTALPEVYSRVAHEFSQAIWPGNRWTYSGLRRVIVVAIMVVAGPVIWCNLEFETLTQIAGFFLANLAVAAAAIAAFYLNHKLPRAYRVHGVTFAFALVSTLILVVATSMSTYGLVMKLRNQFFASGDEISARADDSPVSFQNVDTTKDFDTLTPK
ncbi:MAG: Nramp family divalent metal transporter [Pirellulaceae bacterium]|nr:Nramp family divalent metal transporter [Pirellulaceae bacterium]